MITNRSLRTALSATLAGVMFLAGSGTAFAATDTKNFTVNFKYRLTSGKWDQAAGTLAYSMTCTSGFGETYGVTLYRNDAFGDKNMGTKSLTCKKATPTSSASWTGLKENDYYVTFTKVDNGVAIVGSGTLKFPKA